MNNLTKQLLALAAAATFALPASAITFGDGGVELQGIVEGFTTSGPSSIDVTNDFINDGSDSWWSSTGAGGSVATFIIEVAGFAGSNSFGIYDVTDKSNTVTVFTGGDTNGSQTMISIKLDGSVWINNVDTGTDFALVNGNDAFGFYLDATVGNADPNAIFYSDTSLNTDGVDHLAVYQGTDTDTIQLPNLTPGTWTSNEYLLAWEDLIGGGDLDYTDMVLMVESIESVPEPVILSLLALGLIGVGAASRRRQI